MENLHSTPQYDANAEYEDSNEPSLTTYEKLIFFLMFFGLFVIFLVALWSGLIFVLDAAADKAPLALLMRVVPIHLLL